MFALVNLALLGLRWRARPSAAEHSFRNTPTIIGFAFTRRD